MEGILTFIFGYIILLIIWTLFSVLLFACSYIFKKNLAAIPVALSLIVSIIIQWGLIIYGFYILWQLISNREWLLLILALIFGSFFISWWQFIYELLLAPFKGIALFFLAKIEQTDFHDDTVTGEIIDEKGKVVGITEGDMSIKSRFAKYFIGIYLLNLIPLIIFPAERAGYSPMDFITVPFLRIISLTLIIGIPYGIYRKIRHKPFLTKDKRYFIIQTWKVALYIFVPFFCMLYILAIITNTL